MEYIYNSCQKHVFNFIIDYFPNVWEDFQDVLDLIKEENQMTYIKPFGTKPTLNLWYI